MTTLTDSSKKVTRTVIVIAFPDGNFLFGAPFDNTVDYSENIKYADEFPSIEEAEKTLQWFNSKPSRLAMNGSVKKFSYEVDEKFLQKAENITEVTL